MWKYDSKRVGNGISLIIGVKPLCCGIELHFSRYQGTGVNPMLSAWWVNTKEPKKLYCLDVPEDCATSMVEFYVEQAYEGAASK